MHICQLLTEDFINKKIGCFIILYRIISINIKHMMNIVFIFRCLYLLYIDTRNNVQKNIPLKAKIKVNILNYAFLI